MNGKIIIRTDRAPLPIGPYNQAVLAGNWMFVSGQIALEPDTGELVTGDIKAETRRVMENIGAILEAAGLDFKNIVKTSVFLTDIGNFTAVNEVYGQYFSDADAPARETVQVARLPKNVNVEISVIAMKS
ncbi:MAG TPA: RidA family protein [Chitinophagales bacterium]|nr:RidA family protein [Chitinophagales bacterium]